MTQTPPSTDRLFSCLSDATRRRCLAYLDRSGSVSVPDLAAQLAAEAADATIANVDRAERERVHTTLVHAHLPKLADAGLVEWDREAGTVTLPERSAALRERFRTPPGVDDETWDDVLSVLAASERRAALGALLDSGDPLERRELVRRAIARATDRSPAAVADSDVDDAELSFVHTHLPKLRSAGLIAIDDETVELADAPVPRSALPAFGAAPEPAAMPSLDGAAD